MTNLTESILFAFKNSLTGEQCRSRDVSEAERVQRFNDFEDGFRMCVRMLTGLQGSAERRGVAMESVRDGSQISG